jgi:biopolymer transport protein ExbD
MPRPEKFDVWFVKADTVYKAVPISVVMDWAGQGRLAGSDKVRPAGTDVAWQRVADNVHIGDFLYQRHRVAAPVSDAAEQLQPIELDPGTRKRHEDEDDDVDMIPLIDISLVLLIFFMMTSVVSSLSPVAVPELNNAFELRADAEALTVTLDKRGEEVVLAVRVGDRAPTPADSNLRNVDDLMARVDAKLREYQANQVPEVRIACHKEIERGWIRDIAKELEKRKAKDQISGYVAEVNESKQ